MENKTKQKTKKTIDKEKHLLKVWVFKKLYRNQLALKLNHLGCILTVASCTEPEPVSQQIQCCHLVVTCSSWVFN